MTPRTLLTCALLLLAAWLEPLVAAGRVITIGVVTDGMIYCFVCRAPQRVCPIVKT